MTETFNPRLRLDLSSGNRSLRSLNDSVSRLATTSALPPVPPPFPDDAAFTPVPPVIDFEKTIGLMRGRHTQGMHERHVGSIHKICQLNARGFFLHDLASGLELLSLSAERMLNGQQEYVPAVSELLEAMSIPFQKNRSNDDVTFEQQICELVATVAELALSAPPRIAGSAVEMLLSVAVPPPPPASTAEALAREAMAVGPRIETLKVLKLLCAADVVPAVVAVIDRAEREGAGSLRMSSRSGTHLGAPPVWERSISASLRLLRAVSRTTDGADAILSAPYVLALFGLLRLPLGSPLLSIAVETVWNLAEAAPGGTAALLCTPDSTRALVDLHLRTLNPGASDADKELRNEVVVLSTLLAKAARPEGRACLVSGGLYEAVVGVVCDDSATLSIHATDLNLELLLLALQFLLVMCKPDEALREDILEVSASHGLVAQLVECLAGRVGRSRSALCSAQWTNSQLSQLQKRCLPLLTDLFIAAPGTAAAFPEIAEIVTDFLVPDAPADLRDASIQLLLTALPGSPELKEAAGSAGAIGALIENVAAISYSGGPTSLAPFSTSLMSTTAALRLPSGLTASSMQAAVLAVSMLTDEHPTNQELFGEAGGVACLLPLVRPKTDAALLHAVIECIWSATVPSEANASKLLQRDGVLKLLEVLEGADFAPRAHLLSCLADLVLAHPAARAQCMEWHGSKRQSATQLCLALWSEESARRGAATATGLVASAQRPLTSSFAQASADMNASLVIHDADLGPSSGGEGGELPADGLKLLTANKLAIEGRLGGVGSSSQSRALEQIDVRAKLYALLAALEFESSQPLTSQEELLLIAAKAYVPFAASEVWRDTVDEFAEEGLEVLPDDQKMLDERLANDTFIAKRVIDAQMAQLGTMADEETKAEAAELSRVQVLRDGPMGHVKATKRQGTSLFRARIEAKARIAGMVAASKVAYRGPVPTPTEYADATLAAANEALVATGAQLSDGFTLAHVPAALSSLASAAGLDVSQVTPFLASKGVGLTGTGAKQKEMAHLHLTQTPGPPGSPTRVDLVPLEKKKSSKVSATQLRQLCIDFQTSVQS